MGRIAPAPPVCVYFVVSRGDYSVYASDARSRSLPLLGGDVGEHDWWNMLSMVELLPYDHTIGHCFLGLGIVVFILMLLLPTVMWSR